MGLIVTLLINSIAVAVTAYVLQPHVQIDSFVTAVIVAIVLGVLNTFIKPIISILALPITVLTLGLFSLIINGLFIAIVGGLVEGFTVESFLWAIVFSIVLSLVNAFLGMFANK